MSNSLFITSFPLNIISKLYSFFSLSSNHISINDMYMINSPDKNKGLQFTIN
jgi:hypothetical protein